MDTPKRFLDKKVKAEHVEEFKANNLSQKMISKRDALEKKEDAFVSQELFQKNKFRKEDEISYESQNDDISFIEEETDDVSENKTVIFDEESPDFDQKNNFLPLNHYRFREEDELSYKG